MLEIARRPIEVRSVEEAARVAGCGAVVTFVGIVRERADDGRPVTGLIYETYDSMAIAEFDAIASEARERYGALQIAIVHRSGALDVGEIAVVVSASAPHRAQAFQACSYAIDELKSRAAIWKKERYADGTPDRWRENAPKARA
jgi:molybdopterin synthase catalytic subunit